MEAQFFGRTLTGGPAPEIDGELASHRDDGFFACGAWSFGAAAQHLQPLVNGWIGRLEVDEPPGQFDERGAQARVAVLGHGSRDSSTAAGVLPRAEACVAADLTAVLEATPVADFASNDHAGELA